MRVCLVSFEYPPSGGGEATYTGGLVREYLELGHSVGVMVPSGRVPADLPPGAEALPVKLSSAPLFGVASFCVGVRRLARQVAKRGYDVIHIAFDYPTVPLDLRGAGVPTVATVHHLHFVEAVSLLRSRPGVLASPYLLRQFLLTQAEKRTAARSSELIAVSEHTRRSLGALGLPAGRATVVPNGIDPGPIGAADGRAFRERYALGAKPYVLYVGRLDVSKGLEYLLPAFSSVVGAVPQAVLVIAGRGPRPYVESLRRSGSGREVFTGFLEEGLLRSAYAGASAVVLPSLMEGSGISLLEGMAAGKPCVATRVGGVPEIVEDGRTGVLVRPGDSESLAAGIVRVLTDPGSGEMGARGVRRVAEKFTLRQMAERTLSVYRMASGMAVA